MKRVAGRLLAMLLAAWVGMVCSASVVAGTKEEAFAEGMKAFRSGDYQKAVQQFEQARMAGMEKIAVYYNLGASYYRLGQYDEAKKQFLVVSRHPKMAPVGHYNLGLVARQQKQPEEAAKQFRMVLTLSESKELRYLARRNLREIESGQGVWKTHASVNLGYNDNIDNVTSGASVGADSYAMLTASVNNLFSGTTRDGWQFGGNFYYRAYSKHPGLNFGVSGAKLNKKRRSGNVSYYYGANAYNYTIGSTIYQSLLGLDTGLTLGQGKGSRLTARYRFDSIGGNTGYTYLSGWRQRLRLGYAWHGKAYQLGLRYDFEANDRQNSATQSYTPTRHGVRLEYQLRLGKAHLYTQFGHRISDYALVAAQGKRDDTRDRFVLGYRHKLGRHRELKLQYKYLENQSTDTVNNYNYISRDIYVGVSHRF